MKSKKMTKSTVAIIVMAVLMVAMLAFGGTYAYFTATATAVTGNITTGTVKLTGSVVSTITANNVMPGDTILTGDQNPSYTVETSDTGNWVAIKVEFTGDTVANLTITVDSAVWQEVGSGTGIYRTKSAIANGASVKVFPEAGFTFNADDNWTQGELTSDDDLMGKTITISITAKSIQDKNIGSEGIDEEVTALFA